MHALKDCSYEEHGVEDSVLKSSTKEPFNLSQILGGHQAIELDDQAYAELREALVGLYDLGW